MVEGSSAKRLILEMPDGYCTMVALLLRRRRAAPDRRLGRRPPGHPPQRAVDRPGAFPGTDRRLGARPRGLRPGRSVAQPPPSRPAVRPPSGWGAANLPRRGGTLWVPPDAAGPASVAALLGEDGRVARPLRRVGPGARDATGPHD